MLLIEVDYSIIWTDQSDNWVVLGNTVIRVILIPVRNPIHIGQIWMKEL